LQAPSHHIQTTTFWKWAQNQKGNMVCAKSHAKDNNAVNHSQLLRGQKVSVATVQSGPVQSKFFWTLNWTFSLVQPFAWTLNPSLVQFRCLKLNFFHIRAMVQQIWTPNLLFSSVQQTFKPELLVWFKRFRFELQQHYKKLNLKGLHLKSFYITNIKTIFR